MFSSHPPGPASAPKFPIIRFNKQHPLVRTMSCSLKSRLFSCLFTNNKTKQALFRNNSTFYGEFWGIFCNRPIPVLEDLSKVRVPKNGEIVSLVLGFTKSSWQMTRSFTNNPATSHRQNCWENPNTRPANLTTLVSGRVFFNMLASLELVRFSNSPSVFFQSVFFHGIFQ